MTVIVIIYLFLLGAAFGSFCGAMVWRIRKGRNVISERSECEHCHHTLGAVDLIPVVSWLWLRGKCRYCQKPIGREALALEVGLGISFVVTYICWPLGLRSSLDWAVFVLWLLALVGLTILFVYDLKWFILPDVIVWPLAGLGLLLFIIRMTAVQHSLYVVFLELGLLLLPVTGLYGLIYLISGGKWVGLGDVKLGLFIGLGLGWQGALVALVLANLIGTVVIIPGLASGKLKRSTQIPFGPLLIIGTWLSLLFALPLTRVYLGLLGV